MTFSLSECFLRENYLGSKIPHHTLSIFLVVFVIFYHCFAVTKIRCTIAEESQLSSETSEQGSLGEGEAAWLSGEQEESRLQQPLQPF